MSSLSVFIACKSNKVDWKHGRKWFNTTREGWKLVYSGIQLVLHEWHNHENIKMVHSEICSQKHFLMFFVWNLLQTCLPPSIFSPASEDTSPLTWHHMFHMPKYKIDVMCIEHAVVLWVMSVKVEWVWHAFLHVFGLKKITSQVHNIVAASLSKLVSYNGRKWTWHFGVKQCKAVILYDWYNGLVRLIPSFFTD